MSVHFCQRRWLEFSVSLGVRSLRDHAALQLSRIYSALERLQLRSRHVRLLLPVSRAIGEAVREAYGTTVPQIVLPNVRPGKNGLFLEADPEDIADKMREFAAKEYAFELPETGEALTRKQFAQRIGSIYEACLSDDPAWSSKGP